MPKLEVFPYGLRLQGGEAVETFPAAEIKLLNEQGENVTLYFLIDSGATFSALPKSDGDFLGVDVESGKETRITGVSGRQVKGWRHVLDFKIGENKIEAPVVFLDMEVSPRILGRKGVFDKATIIFEEARKRSGIAPNGSKSAHDIESIMDEAL